MASNNRINIELGFQADTKQAQQQLRQLSTELNAISMKQVSGIDSSLTKEINEASVAATQLQVHLKNAVNINTGKLDLTKFTSSLKQGGVSMQDFAAKLSAIGPQGAQAFANLAANVATAEIPFIRLNTVVRKFGTTLMNTLRWQLSSSLLSGLVSTITEAVGYVSDLNESLTNIRIVTGYGAEEMERFADKANKAAKALNTTTDAYAKASLIYFQQGLSDEQVEQRTNTTIKLANVTGESADTVSEWMTAIWNNFDNGSKSLEHYADVMTALGAATASSSDEIAGGLEKFAAIAKTIGLSYEYAASALATVTAITRQSEDVVGTSFKTIFGRMEGLSLGETTDDGVTLNKYSEALASVGVNILDVNGDLKDMNVILDELGTRWETLSRGQKVALAQVVGGMRQYNQLIALMDNWDYFQQNLNTAMTSEGELSKQAEIYAESWAAAEDRVKASAEAIYNELLDDKAFIGIMNVFAGFLDLINETIDSVGGLSGVLMALGSILLNTFSTDIIAGLNGMETAFMGMTQKGRSALQAFQQQSLKTAFQSVESTNQSNVAPDVLKYSYLPSKKNASLAQTADVYSSSIDATNEINNKTIQNQVLNQQKINELMANRPALERELAQAQANSLNSQQQELQNRAKNLDALREELVQLKNREQYLGKAGSAGFDAGEMALGNITEIDSIKGLGKKDDGTFDFHSSTYKAIQSGLNGLSTNEYIQNNSELSQRLKTLQADIKANKRPAEELTKEYRALNQEIQALVNSELTDVAKDAEIKTKELNDETEELKKKLEEAEIQQKKFRTQLEFSSKMAVPTYKQSIVQLGGAAMQASTGAVFLLSAIESLSTSLEDGKLSMSELSGVLMSFSFAAPMAINGIKGLLSGFKALAVTATAHNAALMENVAATFANISAEKMEQFLQKKGIDQKTIAAIIANKKADATWKEAMAEAGLTDEIIKQTIANYGWQASLGPILGIILAVAAAVALITIGIVAYVKKLNAHNVAAEKAAERAKAMAEAYNQAKEAFDNLKTSMSNYESAKKGLEELTRGTVEFKEAIISANEEALNLIEGFNLKAGDYYYDTDGLIQFNEGVLDQAYSDKLSSQYRLLGAKQAAQIEADRMQQRADLINLDRQLNNPGRETTLATIGGASIGVTAGAAASAFIPVIGPIIGPLVGLLAGALTAGITEGVNSRAKEKQEDAFLELLQEEYNRQEKANGNADLLKTEEEYNKLLDQANVTNENLRKDLIKEKNAIFKLIESNNEIIEAQKQLSLTIAKGYNTDKEAYQTATEDEKSAIDAVIGGVINDKNTKQEIASIFANNKMEYDEYLKAYTYNGKVITQDVSDKMLALALSGELDFEEGSLSVAALPDDSDTYNATNYLEQHEISTDKAASTVGAYAIDETAAFQKLAESYIEDVLGGTVGAGIGQYRVKGQKIEKQGDDGKWVNQDIDLDTLVNNAFNEMILTKTDDEIEQIKDFVNGVFNTGIIDNQLIQEAYYQNDLDLKLLSKYKKSQQDAFFKFLTDSGMSPEYIFSQQTQLNTLRRKDFAEVNNKYNDLAQSTSFFNYTSGTHEILRSAGLKGFYDLLNSDFTKQDYINLNKNTFSSYLAGQGETFAKLLQDTAKGDIDKTIDLNNLIAEFDWNNLFAPEAFIQELEKLNIVLDEEGKQTWYDYAKAIQEANQTSLAFGSSFDNITKSINNFNSGIGNIKIGDTIDEATFDSLKEAYPLIETYFTKVADGYVLLSDADLVKESFKEGVLEPLKEGANELNELQDEITNKLKSFGTEADGLKIVNPDDLAESKKALEAYFEYLEGQELTDDERLFVAQELGFKINDIQELGNAIALLEKEDLPSINENLIELENLIFSSTPAGNSALDVYIDENVQTLEELAEVTGDNIELYEKWKAVIEERQRAEAEATQKAIKALEKELSLTRALEREIDFLNRKIDTTSKVKDRAFGSQRMFLLKQEIALQEEMIDKQSELAEAYKEEANSLMGQLKGYGVNFGTNGLLGAGGNFSGLSQEAAEEALDLISQYEEALNGVWDAQEGMMEAMMESYDLRLEKTQYAIEMSTFVSENNTKLLERLLDKLEDKIFSAAQRMNNLIQQALSYGETINAYDPDALFANFGILGSATEVDTWVKLFNSQPYADRNATIEYLQSSKDALMELEKSIYDLSKSIADTLLEAFEEMGDSFDKINDKAQALTDVIDSYTSIVSLTRQFVEVDSVLIQKMIDAKQELSKTSLSASKSEYEKLLAAQKKAQEEFEKTEFADEIMADYWEKQLKEISTLVDEARADFMSSWEAALQAAADAFKSSVEEITNAFEKSMAGTFGTFAEMQKQYDQQSKVAKIYLAPYERMYELSKLMRKLEKDIDETDNVKARQQLMKLQNEITELQQSQVNLSKDDLTFLQKKYDLRLAEIALEETQKAKNSVILQRNAEGGWGYVYTADQDKTNEAQQKYEDAFYQAYSSGLSQISSNESKLLSAIQSYLSEIKANEGDQEKLNALQSTFGEEVVRYANEIDKAIENINTEVENSNLEGYELISFNETLLGELLKNYDSANAFSEEFLKQLTEQVINPTGESIVEYEKAIQDILSLGGGEDIEKALSNLEKELIEENKKLQEEAKELTESEVLANAIDSAFSEDMAQVFEYYEEVKNSLDKIIAALDAFMEANDIVPQQTIDYWEPSPGNGSGATYSVLNFATGQIKEMTEKEMIEQLGINPATDSWYNAKTGSQFTAGKDNTFYGWGGAYDEASGDYDDRVSQSLAAYSAYQHGADMAEVADIFFGSTGNVQYEGNVISQAEKERIAQMKIEELFSGFDTGGYTGSWGAEGRLALLHQKELVLNAEDTENFLSALGILRSIVDIINLSSIENKLNSSTTKTIHSADGNQALQQVTIHAEFPNATNHLEIEEAFNNLINNASQYANRL